jgi:hypothetical protein
MGHEAVDRILFVQVRVQSTDSANMMTNILVS